MVRRHHGIVNAVLQEGWLSGRGHLLQALQHHVQISVGQFVLSLLLVSGRCRCRIGRNFVVQQAILGGCQIVRVAALLLLPMALQLLQLPLVADFLLVHLVHGPHVVDEVRTAEPGVGVGHVVRGGEEGAPAR